MNTPSPVGPISRRDGSAPNPRACSFQQSAGNAQKPRTLLPARAYCLVASTQWQPASARLVSLTTRPAGRRNTPSVKERPSPASHHPTPACQAAVRDESSVPGTLPLPHQCLPPPRQRVSHGCRGVSPLLPAAPKLPKRNHPTDRAGAAADEKRATVTQDVTAGTCLSFPFPLHIFTDRHLERSSCPAAINICQTSSFPAQWHSQSPSSPCLVREKILLGPGNGCSPTTASGAPDQSYFKRGLHDTYA